MKKILVIALHKLGDNLQVTPVFRVLKHHFPESRVFVLTEKPFQLPFQNSPYIDEIRLFDRTRHNGNALKTLAQAKAEKNEVLKGLSAENLDLMINRHSSIEGAAIASAIGAKEKRGLYMREDGVAWCDDGWTRLLFAACQRRHENPFNFVDYGINVAGSWQDKRQLDLFSGDDAAAAGILDKRGIHAGIRLIAMQPGSNSPLRRWSAQSFARTAELILAQGEEFRVAIIGSPSESALAKEILKEAAPQFHNRIMDLMHEIPLRALPGFLKKCKALITNDTGPMHMAAASGCPVIALYFGESFVNETGPYGSGNIVIHAKLPCLPCTYIKQCERQYACREMVKPGQILDLVRFQAGELETLDPDRFEGTDVHYSGKAPLVSEIRYRPLLRRPASPNDIMRIVYRSVFKEHLSGIALDLKQMADEVAADYSQAGECVNAMVDLDVGMVNLFCRTDKERIRLLDRVRDKFVEFRQYLT